MRPSNIGPFANISSSSGVSVSGNDSNAPKVGLAALPAISSSSNLSFSPTVTRAVSWEPEDSRLSLEPMSLDERSFHSESSEDSLGTSESLASDELEKTSVNCKRKRESENDHFMIEVALEENPDLEKELWDSEVFRDAQMTIAEALQRTFGPLCQKEKELVGVYNKFLDFLIENLQEEKFSGQENFLKILQQKKMFRIEDINRSSFLKESFNKIEKQFIRVLRTLSQEKIESLLSQSLAKSEIQSLRHLLELSRLYQEIDTLLADSCSFLIKDRLYEFPKIFARLGYVDEAIALVDEFSSRFPDTHSESHVLLAVAIIFAKDREMEKAVKAANAIKLDSIRQKFFHRLAYIEL